MFMKTIGIFGVIILAIALHTTVSAQEKYQDRKKFIDSKTAVTDDPRRIPTGDAPRGPEGVLVLKGGRIFDGTGAKVRVGHVVIERNKIVRILDTESQDWPKDAQIMDVSGQTVMPGMVDLHVHLTEAPEITNPAGQSFVQSDNAERALLGVERLRFYIECGITSIRDLASHGMVPFRLKEWVRQNRIPGPRVFAAGQFITGTGGHGAEGVLFPKPDEDMTLTVDGADAWRKAVRQQFNKGADVIKVGSHFSRDEIAAAVEEAHALGLKITADAETFYIQWAVEAGVDMIEHPLPRTDEAIRLMAKKGVSSDITIIPYVYIFDQLGGYHGSTSRRFTLTRESLFDVGRRLRKAGVTIGVGLDIWGHMMASLPEPYIAELKNLVAIGHTVPEALEAATRISAEMLDMGDKLGTLEAGKLADVVVVDGQPDKNLDDLRNVVTVIRDGYIVVRDGKVNIPRHIPAEIH